MKTFSNIKNKIHKYQEEVRLLNENIIKLNDTLKKKIIEYWYDTKFLTIKLDNGKREYYYLSHFDLMDTDYFYGAKICSNGKNLETGKISITYLLNAVQYETINADRFFGKLKTLGINLDGINNPIAEELKKIKPIITHNWVDKKKVVGYCRLSQNTNCKNKYDRQLSLIKNFTENSNDYYLTECFCETVQGNTSISNRTIMFDLIEYCSCNNIHTIIISELNRLGRTKEVILGAISYLNKHGINEIYVLKEHILINEEFITHNYRELNKLAKSCEDEYENIKYRMSEGYKAYIEKRNIAIKNNDNNIPILGRQNYIKEKSAYLKDYEKEIDMLFKSKMSLRQIRTITGTSLGTLQKLKKMFKNEMNISA